MDKFIASDLGLAFREGTKYPVAPFHPPQSYPEFEGSWLSNGPFDPTNQVYSLVREALFRHCGGFDTNTNTVNLTALGRPSDIKKIVVKPNWVRQQDGFGAGVTTHGSVLRPILDYLLLVFGFNIEITVADVPIQSADIEKIWVETGIDVLRDYYQTLGVRVTFMDFRPEKTLVDASGFILGHVPLRGDPLGYVEVPMAAESHLEEITRSNTVFSVDDYEPGTTICYHRPGRHSYLISKTVLTSDLFVNVPKLKTHCKAGITLCMKNLVGINGDKGWIPHYRQGSPYSEGDEYPDPGRRIVALKNKIRDILQGKHRWMYQVALIAWKKSKQTLARISKAQLTAGGAWPGNDTLWRSILDLVIVITLADQSGKLMKTPQRRHLCLIDGIICGEGEGPLQPSPKSVGIILCASNPIVADLAACYVAGFDWKKIPQLNNALKLGRRYPMFFITPEHITVSGRAIGPDIESLDKLPIFSLKPPLAWSGHIEANS